MIARLLHLRLHRATPTMPIYFVRTAHHWHPIHTTMLTQHLRHTLTTLQHEVGVSPNDVSIHSLRASGVMALLCANVDPDKIRLLGRWRSDEMLRYLHIQAFPIVAPFALQMVRHGFFTLLPIFRMG
jgi:hypothetical protein